MVKDNRQKHIAVVEAYQGLIEFLSDEPEDLQASQGLGLPLEQIAELQECRITIFCWDDWQQYESSRQYGSPFTWGNPPVTKPAPSYELKAPRSAFDGTPIRRVAIPARDPGWDRPFLEGGLSPLSNGLAGNNDLFFFVSYCLQHELLRFHKSDPFDLLVFPSWGGLGYMFQMGRAVGLEVPDLPCAVVVTDGSSVRQRANQEGYFTLEAGVRRQMEDLSIALADLVITYGDRGLISSIEGRLPEAQQPVLCPRRVDSATIDGIATKSHAQRAHQPAAFFLYEPQDGASGVLTALDAAALLYRQDCRLASPLVSAGPSSIFGPMTPRTFEDYWSSRGFVRELIQDRFWCWQRQRPPMDSFYPVRIYPSLFEYLPNILSEMARGSLVLMSSAAAEGLDANGKVPAELLIAGDPTPQSLADAIRNLAGMSVEALEELRSGFCDQIVAAHQGPGRRSRLEETASRIGSLLTQRPDHQDLSRIAQLLLDRARPLRQIISEKPASVSPQSRTANTSLSVVVTCYEMGFMVEQTVESLWSSDRLADEILLVDDGSYGADTIEAIQKLEIAARERSLPLKVIRQHNAGLAAARNTGLEGASGEYISFVDGDDIMDSRFYGLALRLLQRYPGIGGVAAWAYCFNDSGVSGHWNGWQPELPSSFTDNVVFVPCTSRTELLRKLGGYDVGFRYNYEDWEMSLRILINGYPVLILPEYLMKYRQRPDSLFRSMTHIQNQVMREALYTKHRDAISYFGPEIGLRLENRLMRNLERNKPLTPPDSTPTADRLLKSTGRWLSRYLRP